MVKIIMINGPSRVGKDTVQGYIPGYREKLSYPLKYMAMSAFEPFSKDRIGYYEDNKDTPFMTLNGRKLSYRQVQIDIFVKMAEVWGDDWLGQLLVSRVKEAGVHINGTCGGVVTISDSGRRAECVPIVGAFGVANCVVVQVSRPGVSYTDIREPVDLRDMDVPLVEIYNDGDIKSLKDKVKLALEPIGFYPSGW
jgi:hypothetical protein